MLLFAILLAIASTACAHGGVWFYTIAGKDYNGYQWWLAARERAPSIQRSWPSRDPIQSLSSQYLSCNIRGTPTTPLLTATVAAGGTIEAHYEKNFLLPGESFKNETWSHVLGPMTVYLAYCGSEKPCGEGFNLTSKAWFKIEERGLLSGSAGEGEWGMNKINRGATWVTTVPKGLKSGYYLVRHEMIAVHVKPAQVYPECGSIFVEGTGKASPNKEELVSFPGVYKESDPGFAFDLWGKDYYSTRYPIPGPPVWKPSGSS